MHHVSVSARALAAGVVGIALGTSLAAAAGRDGNEPVALHDRVFFGRGDWTDLLQPQPEPPAALPSPASQPADAQPARPAPLIVPVRSEDARPAAPVGEAVRAGLPIRSAAISWAATPAVPQLLTKPPVVPRPDGPVPVLEDRERRALEEMFARRAGHPPVHAPALERKRPLTEAGRLPLSKSSRAWLSAPWGDPLALLEIEAEVEKAEEPRQARPARPVPEFIMPFANGRVTSLFNQGRVHPAIDLAGKLGSPVLATTRRQTVTFTGWRGGYGNAVITRDPTGRGHLYAHLKSITARVGQVLEQGDKLGHLGSTGRSTGPHVHYEVTTPKGVRINPVTVLFPAGRKVGKGLAWADVGHFFGGFTQVAAREESAAPVAVAAVKPAAEPRRTPQVKRAKARPRHYATASNSYRSRRAWSDDDE